MNKRKKPIIGILGVPGYNEFNYGVVALNDGYRNSLIKKDCIPFMINPYLDIDYASTKLTEIPKLSKEEKTFYDEMLDMCDGVIIPGGSRMYSFYKYVIERCIDRGIPLFGICMGMQLIASVINKCDCIEKNDTPINHRQKGVKYVHKVKIVKNTLLHDIVGKDEIKVNSRHFYHINKVGDFVVSAYSEDGLIEAIEVPGDKFIFGVQWHPEKMVNYDKAADKIIDRFVTECVKYKNVKETKSKSKKVTS